MRLWFKSILLLTAIGCAKAQHFLHFVILGAFGLIGLWLLGALVKDIDKFFNGVGTKPKFFFKRSIGNDAFYDTNNGDNSEMMLNVDWERILTNDPFGCVPSFVCQIASTDRKMLTKGDGVILRLIRFPKKHNWATRLLSYAVDYGEKVRETRECRKHYNYCPFSIYAMKTLLKYFKSTYA